MAITCNSPTQIIYEGERPRLLQRGVTLQVISGPDKGKTCTLQSGRLSVGTAPENDLQLNDPKVSRTHLEFRITEQGFQLRDLQSTNGTYYREARVADVMVSEGAEIRLGATVLYLNAAKERSDLIQIKDRFGGLIGKSMAMQQVYGMLEAVAPTDVSVLLHGETGTGKEVLAEEIHKNSPRAEESFNVLDCGSMPSNLIESELFGHEQGAFTGATHKRVGIFEQAREGTVFLDEVGELPLELQTRLLRVLDRRAIKRLGGNEYHKVDFRLIAATNRDLVAEVKARRFRRDLYYRLAVVRILVPPLRDRLEDIPLLARSFLAQAGFPEPDQILTEKLLRVLSTRSWPGNVRELRNVIERSTILAGHSEVAALLDGDEEAALGNSGRGDENSLGPSLDSPVAAGTSREDAAALVPPSPVELDTQAFHFPKGFLSQHYKEAKEQLIHAFEVTFLANLVERHGNNISRIASDAGVDRQIIRKLLRRHGWLS